jgi:hypothetical protein
MSWGTDAQGRVKVNPGVVETTVTDGANLDAFSRLRVSNPAGLFDSQFQYGLLPLVWQSELTGAGTATHLPNEASVRLRCGTASGDKVVRQTWRYFRYQPGKSQMILLTGVMGAIKANVRQRIGYFDAQNGIFFEQDGSNLKAVRRTYVSGSAVDNAVNQASWNIDVMDGTGVSGITLDMSKTQIFFFDVEWLGVGRVRCGFVIDGRIYYVHEFLNTNVLATVYMTTANLPCRYEIENTGVAASNTDLLQICGAVASEGGTDHESGVPRSAGNGTTTISVTTRRPILSIRPAATVGGLTNRGGIILERVEALATLKDAYVEIVYGGTLTGASFATAGSESIAEYDVAASAIASGYVIAAGYVSGQSGVDYGVDLHSRLPLTLDINGANPKNLSVVATAIGGTSTVAAAVNWVELY